MPARLAWSIDSTLWKRTIYSLLFLKVPSLALWQSHDWPSASELNLTHIGKIKSATSRKTLMSYIPAWQNTVMRIWWTHSTWPSVSDRRWFLYRQSGIKSSTSPTSTNSWRISSCIRRISSLTTGEPCTRNAWATMTSKSRYFYFNQKHCPTSCLLKVIW